jgi:hypothetical protein
MHHHTTHLIRPRRVPLTGWHLRLAQAVEVAQYGYGLGGEFRIRRNDSRRY